MFTGDETEPINTISQQEYGNLISHAFQGRPDKIVLAAQPRTIPNTTFGTTARYAERLIQAPHLARSNRRNTPLEIHAKRRILERLNPSGVFGPPEINGNNPAPTAMCTHVFETIRTLSYFEVGCIPLVPGTSGFLATFVPYEVVRMHSFLPVPSGQEERVLELLRFAFTVHRTCSQNSANDTAAWYPTVRDLLSVSPGHMSAMPYTPQQSHDLLAGSSPPVIIDTPTKYTSKEILPNHPNVKLDLLLAFNNKHIPYRPAVTLAAFNGCKVNAFADPTMEQTIPILGVKVNGPGGNDPMAAEYEIGVYGMKTLEVARLLATGQVGAGQVGTGQAVPPAKECDIALSLSVCGHVWALHVSYWVSLRKIATHGPVIVGSTETLVGRMKIIMFVAAVKKWARERAWPEWKARIEMALEKKKADAAATAAQEE